jgi:protein phosphatase PTC7
LQEIEKVAAAISSHAVELSKDPNYMSPFSLAAKKYGLEYQGGKPDDITLLIARVSRTQ